MAGGHGSLLLVTQVWSYSEYAYLWRAEIHRWERCRQQHGRQSSKFALNESFVAQTCMCLWSNNCGSLLGHNSLRKGSKDTKFMGPFQISACITNDACSRIMWEFLLWFGVKGHTNELQQQEKVSILNSFQAFFLPK
jgi:hypothetical protein